MFRCVAFCLAVALVQDPAADDLKKMQGTWNAKMVELGGQKSPDKEGPKITVSIDEDQYAVSFNDKLLTKGTLKLDPTQKPKTIDAMPADGPGKGMIQPGIYEFTKDGMRIVFAEPGQSRPKEFKTQLGSKETLIEYRKDKK